MLVLAFLGWFCIATVLHLVLEAKTFNEYSESFLGVAVGVGGCSLFISVIWRTVDNFQLIDDYGNTIAQREYSKTIYFNPIATHNANYKMK